MPRTMPSTVNLDNDGNLSVADPQPITPRSAVPVVEAPDPDNPRAGAPTRATGTLTLGFGTTAIPCAVYAGTEDGGVKRGEYTEVDGEFVKVGRQSVIKDTGTPVERDAIVKMVESSRGLVALDDAEIAAAIGCENGYCEVLRFLPLSVMNTGTYIVDSLYQLRPQEAQSRRGRTTTRRSETTDRAFALLIKAMRLEGVFALVKVALRGKPRYAAFMPDGRLYTLRFTSEVRLPRPLPSTSDLAAEDVMLARMVVAAKTSTEVPVLNDDATEAVNVYVEAKAAETLPEPTPAPVPASSYNALIEGLRAQVAGTGVSRDALALARR